MCICLTETARVGGKEWYFYSQHDRKYASGLRTNRATVSGYWKATGKDKAIFRHGTLVGMRKTLVFYQGRAPKGRKTNWVMHEFRLEGPLAPPKISSAEGDWVLCRVCNKDTEVDASQDMGIGYDDDTSSLSLPPLMDSYITFDQPSISKGQQYEQVPCFSNIFSANYQTNPTFSDITHMEDPIKLPTPPTFTFVGMPEISTFSCEKSVIKSVLNHLTKKGSPSLGKGMMPESFLSDVMWNQY